MAFVTRAVIIAGVVLPTFSAHGNDAVSLLQTSVEVMPDATRTWNLCIGGHLAPEFFLLGAQKAASTTLAFKFNKSRSVVMPMKEPHFFDLDSGAPSSDYLEMFPACRNDVRLVSADCTPAYSTHWGVPWQIRDLYGESFHRIKFAIVLREPVTRMHSGYYQTKRLNMSAKANKYNFSQFAEMLMDQGSDPFNKSEGPFARTDYASALTRWFQVFPPSQFTIIPMLYAIGEGKAYEYLWTHLDLVFPNSPPNPEMNINNYSARPKLEDDVAPKTVVKLTEFVNQRTGSKVLASQLKVTGANLYGCTKCDDEKQISDWLANNWG